MVFNRLGESDISYTPEDMLPDNKDYAKRNGITIRKGTVDCSSALANAEIIESPDATAQEKQAAIEAIKTLIPALKATHLTKFMQRKNPQIQALFDDLSV